MALVFDVQQASGKPDDNRRPGTACPFCDTEGLTNIIQRDGDCIWLENKFKTLRATRQTVLIESADHDADLVTYEPDELHHVMRFALGCWQQMIDSQQYRSVLMYKNKGPLSGGSLVHPHMQIVGLEQEDGYAALTSANFEGIDVWRRGRISVNISTEPIMGFFEVNVSAPQGIAASDDARDQVEADLFADATQVALRYILHEHHGGRAESYNLFFYHMERPDHCQGASTLGGFTLLCRAIGWLRSMLRPRSMSMRSDSAHIWRRSHRKVSARTLRTV